MIRQLTIVPLLMLYISTPLTLAGIWRDDFDDGNLDGWEVILNPGTAKWSVEEGELSAKFLAPGKDSAQPFFFQY